MTASESLATNVRACQGCRAAKTKCDLVRPVCGRCKRRNQECAGYTVESDFVFRSENTVAQRNSERARRKRHNTSIALGVHHLAKALQTGQSNSPSIKIEADPVLPGLYDAAHEGVPACISTSLAVRAVDRWFYDWIHVPSQHGHAVGPLVQVPDLYINAPQHSGFRAAVEALAYAHLQGYKDEEQPLRVKALAMYGFGLTQMRKEIVSDSDQPDIRLLTTVLLFDHFETLHLGRYPMLGPHSDGVRHILSKVDMSSFSHGLKFTTWNMAHHRLLSKQIIHRQCPTMDQLDWTKDVNTSKPDLHLSVSCLKLGVICGQINELVHGDREAGSVQKLTRAQILLSEMLALLSKTEEWLASLPSAWMPQHRDGSLTQVPSSKPENQFGPELVQYEVLRDLEVAGMMTFYQTTSIVALECTIELQELIDASMEDKDHEAIQISMRQNKASIVGLTETILATFPTFVKMAAQAGSGALKRSKARADLHGRFLALFPMLVFQRAKHVPEKAKAVARWVTESIRVDYALI